MTCSLPLLYPPVFIKNFPSLCGRCAVLVATERDHPPSVSSLLAEIADRYVTGTFLSLESFRISWQSINIGLLSQLVVRSAVCVTALYCQDELVRLRLVWASLHDGHEVPQTAGGQAASPAWREVQRGQGDGELSQVSWEVLPVFST